MGRGWAEGGTQPVSAWLQINMRSWECASEFVCFWKLGRHGCVSRSGRQETLLHQTRAGVRKGQSECSPGRSRHASAHSEMAPSNPVPQELFVPSLQVLAPNAAQPPAASYRQTDRAVRPASPPSDQWLGKVDLTGILRAWSRGGAGLRLPRSQGLHLPPPAPT